MLCSKTLSLNTATADNPMDAAIYRPASTSIFAVRSGYVYEFSLGGTQLRVAKFTNPCFSKSCMAYDSVHDKLWVGTMGDWAAGLNGDPGGALPSLSSAGLYRVDPVTLSLEVHVDPTQAVMGGFFFNGAAYVYTMPMTGGTNIISQGPGSGFYDIIFANGKLWACFAAERAFGVTSGYGMSFDPTNPVGSNLQFSLWAIAEMQCTYDGSKVWFNGYGDDLFQEDWPWAINADWSPVDAAHPVWNNFDAPSPPRANGAHGACQFTPQNGGFVYLIELANQRLVKYNLSGVAVSLINLPGATLGGMTMRLRYNSNDGKLYIPCPNANQVIQFDPQTDTVSHIFTTGMDAPHDMVFSPAAQYAVQFGPQGLVALTT